MDFFSSLVTGTMGAIVANITGIGGGVIFYPYLLEAYDNPDTALINSIYIQIVGMGTGSLLWYLKQGMDRQIFIDICRVTLIGYLGVLVGNAVLNLDIDSLYILFSIATIALSVISLTKKRPEQIVKKDRKSVLNHGVENTFIFLSGAVTSQISIGFGECVMLIRYVYDGNFKYAVRLAVTSSTALLIIYALTSPLKADFSIFAPIALGTIPGAIIGYSIASLDRFHKAMKTSVFSLLIGFGVAALVSRFVL